ncbi:hypothetical protein KGQ34_04545 [Patescibacteria group bacterium]|nr:hypothetical protein [Patescibacteria group bacterium]
MIKLKLKLKGDAEKRFQEMTNWSKTNEEKIVLDALNLLHHIMQETRLGRMGGRPVQQNDTAQRHPDAVWTETTTYAPQCKCSKKKK